VLSFAKRNHQTLLAIQKFAKNFPQELFGFRIWRG